MDFNRCRCIKRDGQQCTRNRCYEHCARKPKCRQTYSTDYCWQHQQCTNAISMISGNEIIKKPYIRSKKSDHFTLLVTQTGTDRLNPDYELIAGYYLNVYNLTLDQYCQDYNDDNDDFYLVEIGDQIEKRHKKIVEIFGNITYNHDPVPDSEALI